MGITRNISVFCVERRDDHQMILVVSIRVKTKNNELNSSYSNHFPKIIL